MNRVLRATAGVAAAALVATAVAGARAETIAPGRSIGQVAIGSERAEVEARIGPGRLISRTPDPLRPTNRNLDTVVIAYPRAALVVLFATAEASASARRVATRSPRHRTAGGVGVGSTRAALRAAFPRALCAAATCTATRSGAPGLTRFDLRGNRVVRLVILSPMPR